MVGGCRVCDAVKHAFTYVRDVNKLSKKYPKWTTCVEVEIKQIIMVLGYRVPFGKEESSELVFHNTKTKNI